MTHTPAPWYYTPDDDKRFNITTSPEHDGLRHEETVWVGIVFPLTENGDNEPNARLIATAPELLEALEGLFRECAMIHKYGGEICNQTQADAAINTARAVIKKARGE